MDERPMGLESSFDIERVSFKNVSKDFETKFKDRYEGALAAMSDARGKLQNLSGVSTLGVLETMAHRIKKYDGISKFEDSFNEVLGEYERVRET